MKLVTINSRQNQRIRKLLAKERNKEVCIFEGTRLVQDLLHRGLSLDVLVVDRGSGSEPPDIARRFGHLIHECWRVSPSVKKKISNLKTPGLMIAAIGVPFPEPKGMDRYRSILVLEDIQDPGNCGTVFRSAAAFGIDCIMLTGRSVSVYNRKFLRGAQDSIFELDFGYSRNTLHFLESVDPRRFTIYTTTSSPGADGIPPENLRIPCVVVFGNEGRGLRRELLGKYSVLTIPHVHQIESLNLAASAAIISYEIFRHTQTSHGPD